MTKILIATGLRKSFGKGEKRVQAVDGVSIYVNAGEILAFLGPNGAGKTTTIKMVAGLVVPDQGNISVNGLDPVASAGARIDIGAVLEGNRNLYFPMTCLQNLEYFGVLKGLSNGDARKRAGELLELVELTHKANTKVSELSRGMQQKLAIAVAMVQKPKLLMLDEPTIGLDVEAAEAVKVLLRDLARQGYAIVLTTHQMDVAQEVADRITIIRDGKVIVEAPTAELISQFSSKSYKLTFEGVLSEQQLRDLARAGATVDGQQIGFDGEAKLVYDVVAAVFPLRITSLAQDSADLSRIFLRLIKEDRS